MSPRVTVTALCIAALSASAALAQSYPSKPIRLVVPFAPGGPADAGARTITQKLTETSGIAFIIDNRAGAGGTIGADVVAKAPPDGYTLLLGSPGPLSIAPSLYPKLPYDPVRSFAPVVNAIASAFVVVVHPSIPAKNVKELVALAKARPGELHFGSAGNGSVLHLAGELFNNMAGVKVTHVPYKGGGPALIDLLAGQVQLMIVDIPLVLPHVTAAKLRPLGVTGRARSAQLPAVPTVHESGVPGYEVATWSGFLAPAGTPADTIGRLHGEFSKVLSNAELRKTFAAQAVDIVAMPPERFGALIREETEKWSKVVRTANVKLD